MKTGLDLYVLRLIGLALMYPEHLGEYKIALLNRGWQPPCLLTSLPLSFSPFFLELVF
jgi:hypothetical protein